LPAAGRYPLPEEPNPEIRRLDARDLSVALLADGLEGLVAVMADGPARTALLDTLHAVRPDALREVRRREAARLVGLHLVAGCSKTTARKRAAAAVGVSTWQVRVAWGL
jgi:hypothetical protein